MLPRPNADVAAAANATAASNTICFFIFVSFLSFCPVYWNDAVQL
jgi:hypothetical protein